MTSRTSTLNPDARQAQVESDRMLDLDGEPSLEEILDDPVIQAVMAQDGVERQDVMDLVASIQSVFFR